MKNKKVLLIAIIFLLGLLVYQFTNKQNKLPQTSAAKTNNEPSTSNPSSPPLGAGMAFKNFFVYFGKDQVLITSFEGQPNNKGGILKSSDYPELFRAEGGGEFFLTAREVNDKVHGKQFVYISKDVFSHGAYVDVYGVIFDPAEGTVVYITPKELAMSSLGSINFLENDSVVELTASPYFFFDGCISCKLPVYDFQRYDPSIKKFVTVNSEYKSAFQALLDEYNKIAETKCSYNGKITSVIELQKTVGNNARCENSLGPNNNDFITVGEFLKIRDDIQQVVNGQKESMLTKDNQF